MISNNGNKIILILKSALATKPDFWIIIPANLLGLLFLGKDFSSVFGDLFNNHAQMIF